MKRAANHSSHTDKRDRAADPGVYRKGKNRAEDILKVAVNLLIENGYHKLSMRRVASEAGISLGNLQHYFATREELVSQMITHAIDEYIQFFDEIRSSAQTPEVEFAELLGIVIRDLNKQDTTVFFPELWAIANHEPQFNPVLDGMYARWRNILARVIAEINPTLSPEQVQRAALFISASVEGHTPFIGQGKPWTGETEAIVSMAAQSFLWLVRQGDIPHGALCVTTSASVRSGVDG